MNIAIYMYYTLNCYYKNVNIIQLYFMNINMQLGKYSSNNIAYNFNNYVTRLVS